ncbi:MAG: tyrosine-type recombinase/integrase, partial [Polyangia bacterium]
LTRAALRKIAKVLFGMRLLSIDERQRIDDVSPARGKRLPRGRALSSREIRELFAVCAKDETAAGRRDAALIAIMFGGGLRRDEVSKLDRADSDESGNLRVEGKGNKESLQPIVPEVVQAVRAWLAVRGKVSGEDAEALFVVIGKSGKVGKRRLDGKAIAWKVARRAAEAGIEPMPKDLRGRQHLLSPHDLRRSFVTSLLELGEDLSTVAKAARHASVATVAIYDRRDERKVAEAVAKLHVPVGR